MQESGYDITGDESIDSLLDELSSLNIYKNKTHTAIRTANINQGSGSGGTTPTITTVTIPHGLGSKPSLATFYISLLYPSNSATNLGTFLEITDSYSGSATIRNGSDGGSVKLTYTVSMDETNITFRFSATGYYTGTGYVYSYVSCYIRAVTCYL
jgi:hypothetical protein